MPAAGPEVGEGWHSNESRADVVLWVVVNGSKRSGRSKSLTGGTRARCSGNRSGDGGSSSSNSSSNSRDLASLSGDAKKKKRKTAQPRLQGGLAEQWMRLEEAADQTFDGGAEAGAEGKDGRIVVDEMQGHALLLKNASGWAHSRLSSSPGQVGLRAFGWW
jgi:hypothetical protein